MSAPSMQRDGVSAAERITDNHRAPRVRASDIFIETAENVIEQLSRSDRRGWIPVFLLLVVVVEGTSLWRAAIHAEVTGKWILAVETNRANEATAVHKIAMELLERIAPHR